MAENDPISDETITKKEEEETKPKKNQNSYDYYSLLSDKLLYFIKFRDRLLIFTTIITLTVLSLSIPTNNIYAPVLVSLVAFIFFIKWCNIKKEITKLSAYLRVFYEQPRKREESCWWESDYAQYDKKYNTLCRFENLCLYISWIILAIIPFLISLGIFLLDKTDGKPGITVLATTFMDGINLSLVLVGILTIIWILLILITGVYWTRKPICWVVILTFVALMARIGLWSPFCSKVYEVLMGSPSVLIVIIIELIFASVITTCVIVLGHSLSEPEKFDGLWSNLSGKQEIKAEINTPEKEGTN